MAKGRSGRLGLWIIVGLLIIGLGGWYTGGAGAARSSLGTVGGLEVPIQSYATALRNQMDNLQQQTGQPVDFEMLQALGIDRAVLGQVVAQRVLDAEARRLGLSVGDARVAEAVRGIPAFQGLDGQFDRQAYREALRRNGLNETEFETSLREDTTRTILQAAVLSGLPEPVTYGETLAAFANESRTATWAALGSDAVAVAPQASEEELRAYWEAHPDRFTAPELREVSYAWLVPEMLQEATEVDEAAVRALYDARIDEFVQEERRLVERLVYPSPEAAAEARARLDAGEADFEALVEERGLLLSDTDLGDVALAELGPAGEPVFAAAAGEVVGPVETSLGPALYRVNAVLAADETSFEEAEPLLRAELATEAAREIIEEVGPELEDLVAGGATVADIAERTELEPGRLALSEGVSEGPAAYAEFREAAFAAEPEGFPEVVELSDGGIVVFHVESVTPPAVRPFEEARAEVEKAWAEEAVRAEVLERAEAAAAAIAGGASFEDQGLTPREEANLTRRSAVEGTTPDFMPAVFDLAPGEARAIPTEDGAIVVRLDAVAPADPEAESVAAESAAIAAEVSGAIAQDLYEAYARALQAGTEIRIDEGAVAAVNAQFE